MSDVFSRQDKALFAADSEQQDTKMSAVSDDLSPTPRDSRVTDPKHRDTKGQPCSITFSFSTPNKTTLSVANF